MTWRSNSANSMCVSASVSSTKRSARSKPRRKRTATSSALRSPGAGHSNVSGK